MKQEKKHIAVLGAGMVGVSTAIWLHRAGHRVTLVDREGIAAGASYGNAGILASSGIMPVASPGLIFKAPAMLFSPNQPLFLRWSYLPRILPWLVRFLARANHRDMVSTMQGLYGLMFDSYDQHMALAKGTGAEKFLHQNGWFHGFKNRQEYLKDKSGWEIAEELGIETREMTPDEFEAFDPQLKGRFGHGLLTVNDGQISDPGEYIKTLANHFVGEGGSINLGEVRKIHSDHANGLQLIFADDKKLDADEIVVTAGAHSARLLEGLGYKIPLESERGYHLEFVNANLHFKAPLMVTSAKFGVNSMNGRLRCAGVVELGGVDAPPSRAPFNLLKSKVAEIFPDLKYDEVREWMGHRPSTPDALPVIGQMKNHPKIWAGFGHQHLGLTGGPRTGKWLSQLISGERINEDLSAFDPNRF